MRRTYAKVGLLALGSAWILAPVSNAAKVVGTLVWLAGAMLVVQAVFRSEFADRVTLLKVAGGATLVALAPLAVRGWLPTAGTGTGTGPGVGAALPPSGPAGWLIAAWTGAFMAVLFTTVLTLASTLWSTVVYYARRQM